LEGRLQLEIAEGINLRHAKDKILFANPDATDLTDWTFEQDDELLHFLLRNNIAPRKYADILGSGTRVKAQPSLAANH
jgi:hypothetical protein